MTVIDAVLAFPIALYMAKVASPRVQRLLVIAVLMPLWASYLVKAYAWRGMLSPGGLDRLDAAPFGLALARATACRRWSITLAYLWLPYMILPMYAGLERVPDSLFEASADLGGGTWTTIRRVVLPMAFPAIVAGSIFTFSLSLGDYIAVKIVGGTSQLLGNVVYDNVGAANNLPFAAAVATVPVVVMVVYLARRGVPVRWRTCEPSMTLSRARGSLSASRRPRAGGRLHAAGAGGAQLLQHRPHVRAGRRRLHPALVGARRGSAGRALGACGPA